MTRWFHVAFFAEPAVQCALDQVVYLLNPEEKLSAHVTLRGPFKTAQAANQNVSDLFDGLVSILGAGRFPPPQHTVYLVCGSSAIRERWWKPDYNYNPHITIYDGKSELIAAKAYSILKEKKLFATTTLSSVRIHQSTSGQKDANLTLSLDFAALSELAGRQLDPMAVQRLSTKERLICFDRLVDHLKRVFSKV